ncbi:MAG: hypothetical protein H8K07_20360 [Nitrospira sp.]|nr:hypothetical protein [Nitrospira sp.]
MVSFNFTQKQRQAIRRSLNDVGLEDAIKWPIYLDSIERVVQRALHKSRRDAEEPKLYAQKAHKRLADLYEALNTTIQHYESLGGELQQNLDSFLLLDPLLNASFPASARSTAELVLSSGRLPHALRSLAEATNQCAVSLNHQNDLFPKTGAPKKYVAFHKAVEALMLIFREATGQTPTVYSNEHSDARYKGTFYPFAVAVLGPARLVPDKQLGSNLLTAYKKFTAFLYKRKPMRKKKKSNKPPA